MIRPRVPPSPFHGRRAQPRIDQRLLTRISTQLVRRKRPTRKSAPGSRRGRSSAMERSDERHARWFLSSDGYAQSVRAGAARRLPLLRGARVGGVGAVSGCRCVGRRFARQVRSARSGSHHRNASGRAARCALRYGGGRVGQRPMEWARGEKLALPPGPADEHARWGARQLACGHPAVDDRDHRIVGGHPAVTVSSQTGVPRRRGRPPTQPRGFGSAANPAISTGAGSTPTARSHPRTCVCATGVRPGSGAARQPDACVIRSTEVLIVRAARL
jgi:hypothetical protein